MGTSDRTLIILRHAKAERPEGYAEDFDRPLAERGHLDARAAGEWLAETGLRPDAVLCSSAVRTRETWLDVAQVLGEVPVIYEPGLYEAGLRDALELVVATRPEVGTLLIVGHNPTMSLLSGLLDPGGGDRNGLRTGGLAVHRLSGAWTAYGPGTAPLVKSHTARG